MRMRTLGYGLLAVSIALGACSSDSEDDNGSGGSSGTSGMPLDDVRDALVELQCNAIDSCASDLMSIYLSGMDCESYFGRIFEDGEWSNMVKAVEDGRIVYHGDKAQDCLDAWAALECDMFTKRAPDICNDALEGTVDEGGSCTLNGECKGSLYCKVSNDCPGVCAPREDAGASCKSDDACKDGLTCDDSLEQCVQPGTSGDACDQGEPECLLGVMCVGADEDDGTPGTCKETSEVFTGKQDEPCDFEGGTYCELGLSCVLENWTASGAEANCRTTADSGGTCGLAIPSHCPAGEYCNADPQTSGSFEGQCVPLPGEGEPCATTGFQTCQPYHVCVNDVCHELKRLDGSCGADDECYSDNCESGVCTATDACTAD